MKMGLCCSKPKIKKVYYPKRIQIQGMFHHFKYDCYEYDKVVYIYVYNNDEFMNMRDSEKPRLESTNLKTE